MGKRIEVRQQGDDQRCDAISYQHLLEQESVEVPEILKEDTNPYMGSEDVPLARWVSRDFHELEKEKLWPHVWQVACREEELPEVGDHIIYEICENSFIVARTQENKIQAFYNSCLHRGRILRNDPGQVREFVCPFHGFTWNLDGSFKSAPCEWDFTHFVERDPCEKNLPEVRVATWGGFVFINMDENAPDLEEYLEVLPEHFKRWPIENYFKGVHVKKRIEANWKTVLEAFVESFHAVETHPQILPYSADANSQYDIFSDNISRTITPMAVPSPHMKETPSEWDILSNLVDTSGRMAEDDSAGVELKDGQTAREFMAETNRAAFEEASGEDLSKATNSELLDAILYSVFPNFFPWAGYHGNIMYRIRPDGDRHDACVMEVMMLLRYPKGEPRPEPVPVHELTDEQDWSEAEELGALGPIFDQDMGNLPFMLKGMRASKKGAATLANYQESRIRHFHETLNLYLFGDKKNYG